ncbi:conserved hypothetical protein [Methylobacterium sp. 4-46]|uniref:hypothetical protein n=1 Tax=unclassified Methylobacterium TaxID=2615210 RepID=UPI000152D4AB|nr:MULTISPECIES: hypothetical protein [Methylobacterium]ACA18194.1 conserved hypothetical protein [Methylobacterium sp. 4-46]WFT77489.1 hypothetical protein QA634_19355 [Methylobacterium nodulans]
MNRRPISLAVGVACLAACGLAAAAGTAVMPSYLAAWLVLVSLPAGALPLLMGLELAGFAHEPMAASLRRLLALLPIAALLLVPILLNLGALYGWGRGLPPRTALAAIWFTPAFFTLRSLFYLAVWLWLAETFRRAPLDLALEAAAARRRRAVIGMVLHAVLGTLAAEDWVHSVDPARASAAFGLLVMTIQAGLALSAAALIAARASSGRPLRDNRMAAAFTDPMLVLLACWGFVHFVQYLVVWSANLPDEVRWYLDRGGTLARVGAVVALATGVLALLVLLPRRVVGRPAALVAIAALVLVLHGAEMFWLVTPGFRGAFRFTWPDMLALVGVVGVAAGLSGRVERSLWRAHP